jgi:RNase H-like domain found in reverse transcriptase
MRSDHVSSTLTIYLTKTIKELRSYLGTLNYIRMLISYYRKKMEPLRKLLRGNVKRLNRHDSAQECFQQIKTEIKKLPRLLKSNFKNPLKICTNSSNYTIGSYIFQTIKNKDRILSFLSKTLNKNKVTFSTIQFELYRIVLILDTFRQVVHSSNKKIEIYTDHANLTKYALLKIKQTRLLEWFKLLSQYSFIIQHIPCADNDFADKLSGPTGTSREDEETKNYFTSVEMYNMNTIKNNTETEEEEGEKLLKKSTIKCQTTTSQLDRTKEN